MHDMVHHSNRLFMLRRGFAALAACAICCATAAEQPSGDTLLIGGGVGVGPRYAGAKQNAAAPVLLLDYSMANGVFASTLRGLGYGGQAGPLRYSAALGYRGGRSDKDETSAFGNSGGARLKGMGKIEGNASAALGVGYALLPELELGASADVPLSHTDNGKNLHLTLTGQLIARPGDSLSLALAAGFGDSKYGQTYYGVSAAQAARTPFKAYRAGSGLYETGATLTWVHTLDARWNVTTMLGVTALVKDAADSPLSERKTAPSAAVYAAYRY